VRPEAGGVASCCWALAQRPGVDRRKTPVDRADILVGGRISGPDAVRNVLTAALLFVSASIWRWRIARCTCVGKNVMAGAGSRRCRRARPNAGHLVMRVPGGQDLEPVPTIQWA